MRTGALMSLTIVAGLLLGVSARAQQPPASEPASRGPPPPDYGAPIVNEQAKTVADAAIAEAMKNNWHIAVAVVGPQGDLVYFEKMDGTQNASAALAQAKARTSALFRRPSKVFADQFAAGNAAFMTFPGQRAARSRPKAACRIVLSGKLIWRDRGQRRYRRAGHRGRHQPAPMR